MQHVTYCRLAVGLLLAALPACEESISGPEAIEYSLEVSDSELVFGERFDVDLVLRNPTAREVALMSPMSCLALPHMYRGDVRVDWDGTALGCLAAVGRHIVPARGELVVSFELRAALRGGSEPFEYEVEPEPGVYQLRLELFAPPLPDLTTELLVVE